MVSYVRQKITVELIYPLTNCCHIYRAANHYNFLFFITPLCLYSENYDKSAFFHNSSKWCSSDTVLAAHSLHCLCRLVFQGVCPDPRQSLVQHSLCGAYHTAVALDRMA